MTSPVFNINTAELESWSKGTLYGGADVRIGPKIGVKDLGISFSEVPPGKSGCPFHNHHVEDEIFIILEGEGTYRFGKVSYPIKAGDVLGAPAGGQETAHQIINTGSVPLRYFGISTMSLADVCEYPDSGKFGVFSRSTRNPYDKATLRHLQHLDHKGVDYWVDEPGAEEGK
ncbi:MAG: cupin domain-containing protein [Devosia sp.]